MAKTIYKIKLKNCNSCKWDSSYEEDLRGEFCRKKGTPCEINHKGVPSGWRLKGNHFAEGTIHHFLT